MRTIPLILAILTLLLTPAAHAQYTFTYQGQLQDSGSPAQGPHTLRFLLYDDITNPTPIENLGDYTVDITDGLFSIDLNCTTIPAGLFLEIVVVDTVDHTLAPRQHITDAPSAIYSRNTRGIHVTPALDVGLNTTTPGAKLEVRAIQGQPETLRLSSDDAGIEMRHAILSNATSIQSWNPTIPRPAPLLLNPDGGLVQVSENGIGFSDGSRLLRVPGPDLVALIGSTTETREANFIGANNTITLSIPIPGAQPGDIAIINPAPTFNSSLIIHAATAATNVVAFRVTNISNSDTTLAPTEFTATVLRP
jgi:hypothetical protein